MSSYSIRTAAKMAALTTVATLAIGSADPVRAQGNAQTETTDLLLACDKIIDIHEKLACFDAVVNSVKHGRAAPVVDSPAPAPAAQSTITESIESPVVTAAPEPAAAEGSSIPANAPDTPTAASATEVDDFGRESMKAERSEKKKKEKKKKEKKKDMEPIQATIVRSWRNHDDRFSVELDNGQVWRETQGTRVGREPKEGRSVKISEGRFGGYRMKIDGIPSVAWVRRTK